MRKLNLGAGPHWRREGWATTDHKTKKPSVAWRLNDDNESYDVVFSSHMFEHIPHFKVDDVLAECNRVLKTGGVIRLVLPNLEVFADAYVSSDHDRYKKFLQEDTTIRTDLGLGGMFMNFVVSPGSTPTTLA